MAEKETSSTPENPVVDNRSADEKALTSHLKDVVIPDESGVGGAASSAEPAEIKLPKTLKATLDLIQDGNNYQPKDAADATRKLSMLEKLRAHAHALSQGPTCKPLSADTHADLAGVSSAHAEEIHLAAVARTDRIVAERLAKNAETIKALEAQIAALTQK